MGHFVLLVLCLGLGAALRATKRLPEDAHLALNGVVVHVALPALTFATVRHLRFEPALALAAAMPWLVFALGLAFFLAAGRCFGLSRATIGGLVLTGALGNTSFVGLPLIEAFFGRAAMPLGLVIDQLGSYLVLSTLGLVAAALFSGAGLSRTAVAGRLLRFPPLQALVAAVVLAPLPLPQWLDPMLLRLGDTIAPLAMLSVGAQLRVAGFAAHRLPLSLGLAFKLVLAPLVLAPVYLGLPAAMQETARVTLFEAAMAPMIGGGVIAMQHRLDAPLVSLMLGVGIPLSLLTVPAWWWVLSSMG
jgi:predicted permease